MTGDRITTAAEGLLEAAEARRDVAKRRYDAALVTLREAETELSEAEVGVDVARERVDREETARRSEGWTDPLGRQPGDVLLDRHGQEWRVISARPREGWGGQLYAAEYLVDWVDNGRPRGPEWIASERFLRN